MVQSFSGTNLSAVLYQVSSLTMENTSLKYFRYTSAIGAAMTSEDERLAYLGRSLANLRLRRPEKALPDAVYGNGAGLSPEKKPLS